MQIFLALKLIAAADARAVHFIGTIGTVGRAVAAPVDMYAVVLVTAHPLARSADARIARHRLRRRQVSRTVLLIIAALAIDGAIAAPAVRYAAAFGRACELVRTASDFRCVADRKTEREKKTSTNKVVK